MTSCPERKSISTPESFYSSTGMFNIDSPELKLLYRQNTPFWKKKCFLFPAILIVLTVLSLLTFFAIDSIYNQGKSSDSIWDFVNASRQKFENPLELRSDSGYKKSSRSVQQQVRRFRTNGDEVLHEQETFVPCELNDGIKELSSEIKRLYESLERLDDRVNREKRGLHEQTGIADCVDMKGKFKKIYEDLNRISETLSMMDDNGICRCKCPLEKSVNTTTTTGIIHVTDLPIDLTTFAVQDNSAAVDKPALGSSEKTKQRKKIILSDYKPLKEITGGLNDRFKSVTDRAVTSQQTVIEDQFTVLTTLEDTDTITTTAASDAREDMSPEMSNSVTKYLSPNGQSTYVPQTLYYVDDVTKDYRERQSVTSESPKSRTDVTDSKESTTESKYEMSTIQEERSGDEGLSKLTTTSENISQSTSVEPLDKDKKETDNYVTYKTVEATPEYGNRFESTTSDTNEVTDVASKSTYRSVAESTDRSDAESTDRNVAESTTDASEKVTNVFKSTYMYENSVSESMTELSTESNQKENYSYSTEAALKPTSAYEGVSELTSEASSSEDYNKIDTGTTMDLTSTKYANFKASTTIIPTTSKTTTVPTTSKTTIVPTTSRIVNDKVQRTSTEDQDRINNKLSKENEINRFDTGKPTVATSTATTVQPKWQPVCFYPVPCPQSVQPNPTQQVQYSAQSLSAHKKNAQPVTVIKNDYPIISYCPVGMVCTMIDTAGQPNVLHCTLKPVATSNGSDNANKTEESKSIKVTKDDVKTLETTKAKSARDSDAILTGNLDCPSNTFPCLDDSGCVDSENWCDGRIHCNDASDESQCNCKERIDKEKLCDGYYDCPTGEDELGCFGCNNDTFSCGDWNVITQRSTCFERKTRCDFTVNCPNGRDEDECTLLSRHLENPEQIFFVSYSTGYLHHNWKGNWYPMCGDGTSETWAAKACTVESGELSKPSKIDYVNEVDTYEASYISIDRNNIVTLLDSCKHQGILVECTPESCGIRSDLKFNKNIDPDRLRRSPDSDLSINSTVRFARSKDPRVVGGIASIPGAWPWLIALYQDGIFHCGGVILSEQWVLTAAHCVNQYEKHFYEVQAGILRRFSFSPMEQSRTVTHVIVHTLYSRTTMENDLAVMRLDRNLEFNRWVRPVCLPDQKLDWIPFPGTICTAVGWGSTVEHGPDPDNMREVEVPILAECTHKTDIDGREICAGYLAGGHDTCQGDSGGPLLCREPNNLNKWYVAGIVSHGEGCARPMEPGVYTRVALFMDWIIRVTEEDNLPRERPQEYCPGIRCKTGKQCIPTKRQCDKYVDCMNAEDEQHCDYTGSQYHVNLYRSRNTDHSNLKYSSKSSKSAEAPDATATGVNVTTMTTIVPRPMTTVVLRATNVSSSTLPPNNTVPNANIKVETQTIEVKLKNMTSGLNDTVLNAIRQLFDNQFTENTYSCGRITQVVLSSHRCDGTVDCEDGTDEESCDCRTRLTNMFNASAICDGLIDCRGGTDETIGCGLVKCRVDEMLCGRSNKCVKKTAWCNGVVDCGEDDGSDEKHCLAITNGTTNVESDATGHPKLRRSGMVAVNRKGVWRVRCVEENTATRVADETCSSLNFLNSEYFEKQISWNSILPLNMSKLQLSDVCHGLYVECGPRKTVELGLYHWHVDVLVNGTLSQPGVLIKDSWVLVKRTGLNLKTSYAMVVLGGSAYSSVWIESPHEQAVRVDGVRPVSGTDYDLLHLSRPADANRAVGPLGVPLFQPPLRPDHACYAIGYAATDPNIRTVTAVLRPDARRCDAEDALCFTVSRKPQSCTGGSNGKKNASNVTAIVCESDFGLFLAAPTVQRSMDFCNRNARVQLPAAEELMNGIVEVTEERVKPTPAPVCHGKRCKLGKCVPWEKVCDGIPDCRDEQDETIKMCQERITRCKIDDALCICDVGSFRCANGKCVPKTAFCDGINHCGDGTDEPKTCQQNTCVDYLKLTAPERLCDGRWDCLDKTDEEFTNCPGYCNRTNVYQCQSSNKCISSELVCDGEEDCPESDDEAECIGLITPAKKSNEGVLAIRSYGNWHAQCITEDYTNVDYHSLCKGLGFKHAVGIKKIASTKVDFENFTIVQLNTRTDVTVRSATKNILQPTNRECQAAYVVCSSS